MKKRSIFLLFLSAGLANACSGGDDRLDGEWLIPKDQIVDGGPGKDGIPALENPQVYSPAEATYLTDTDLVVGYAKAGTLRAYPHRILDWHEIINDSPGGAAISVTYCPLTGSATGWQQSANGFGSTYGVSGLLFNSNLIPYDRATDSNWSQMLMMAVNGPRIGEHAELVTLVETTWGSWKSLYPATGVVSTNTGHARDYGRYPYGDYRTNHEKLLFPVNVDDPRLPRKERVHGIRVGSAAKAYRFTNFDANLSLIQDTIGAENVVVIGSQNTSFIVSFSRVHPDGTALTFTAVSNQLPIVMQDNQTNTTWDMFGQGIAGTKAGTQLKPTRSYIAYWFAWAAFYPQTEIN